MIINKNTLFYILNKSYYLIKRINTLQFSRNLAFMIASRALYQKTLNLCELTEKVSRISHMDRTTKAFSIELTHCLIEDSILLKSSIHSALYEKTSVQGQYRVVHFALILVKNLQGYLKGLEYDTALQSDYTRTLIDELKGYRKFLSTSYSRWKVYLN